jgi:hypothetical protein
VDELEQGCVGAVKAMKLEVEAEVASEEGSVVYVNIDKVDGTRNWSRPRLTVL